MVVEVTGYSTTLMFMATPDGGGPTGGNGVARLLAQPVSVRAPTRAQRLERARAGLDLSVTIRASPPWVPRFS
jgi:hypothetical protein